jgi:hypothetical protein
MSIFRSICRVFGALALGAGTIFYMIGGGVELTLTLALLSLSLLYVALSGISED